jgi:hypothetical protein
MRSRKCNKNCHSWGTPSNKPAYDLALELNSEYTTSPKLTIAFLLAVEARPGRAAKRLVRHFETKLDLFGRDKLVKDIEISDLDEYDMEALGRIGGLSSAAAEKGSGRTTDIVWTIVHVYEVSSCQKYGE